MNINICMIRKTKKALNFILRALYFTPEPETWVEHETYCSMFNVQLFSQEKIALTISNLLHSDNSFLNPTSWYHLKYSVKKSLLAFKPIRIIIPSWRRELNTRPADYESAALPTELLQLINVQCSMFNCLSWSWDYLTCKFNYFFTFK